MSEYFVEREKNDTHKNLARIHTHQHSHEVDILHSALRCDIYICTEFGSYTHTL